MPSPRPPSNKRFPGKPAARPPREPKAPPRVQPTTLWDYPSQSYPGLRSSKQGDEKYPGVTPSYVIWNLIQRYTRPGDLVLDPFCGSGTTLDVAADTNRKARGFDLAPVRPDIERADARQIPVDDNVANLVFIDPPYSTHIDYSDDPRCIGKLPAAEPAYFKAMNQVLAECARVLKPGGVLGIYVCDSYVHSGQHKGFFPIGFELYALASKLMQPLDIVAVTRRNKTLDAGNYRKAAEEQNFFLRGFNYLLLLQKPTPTKPARKQTHKPGKRNRPRGGKGAIGAKGGSRPPRGAKSS